MDKPVTFAICGCGNRGLETYAAYQSAHPEQMRVIAGADCRPERLAILRERYDVPVENCFATGEELLDQPRLADVLVIATQDRQHVDQAVKALEKGYHLLLEKPISPSLAQCRRLLDKAHETGRAVTVCHVLRYTKFYETLEAILRRGDIGKLETLEAAENVAYWHYARSFVRGNWRRSGETSPLILAKSCHDMDILRWLAGGKCLKVQSFGGLDYFRAECAPEGAALYCLDGCGCKEGCPYDAEKIYITAAHSGVRSIGKAWPCRVVAEDPTEEALYDALRAGPYGRCVFHCDNDVADHQTVNLEFENGVHAVFTLTAFTERCHRTIKATGTLGEVQGDISKGKLILRRFGKPEEVIDVGCSAGNTGHGGGDAGLMDHMCRLAAGEMDGCPTSIDASVESHVMALAAEASRLAGGEVIQLSAFEKSAQ